MNAFASLTAFFYALTASLWLTLSAAVIASASSAEMTPALRHRPPSSLTLPSRSVVLSALLHHHRRHLQENFASLNQIFAQISLNLPDAQVSRGSLDLTISRLECRNISVRDIRLSHDVTSATSQRLDVTIAGLKIDCSFDWRYKYKLLFIPLSGDGSGSIRLDPVSSASVGLQFTSENYATHPPHDASVPDCSTRIEIADMEFSGGIAGTVVNLFEGLLRDTVEGEIGSTVCAELRGLGEEKLDGVLLQLSETIETYLEPLEASASDPLHFENALAVPALFDGGESGASLYLNFQELDEWITSALEQADSFLGPSDAEPDGRLGINSFIRDNFLEADGTLVLDPALLAGSGVVFEGHDTLTETTMAIKSIRIQGLDSFQEMDVLDFIGKHTIRNKFKLDYLEVVVEMEAEMKASSLDDAMIVAANTPPIKEEFTVDFIVSGIEVDASLFLGVNTDSLGNVELGSLLHSDQILPCLLGALDAAHFTGLAVSVADVTAPKLTGFLDGGIDQLMSAGADALFHMYERVLLRALPHFFQTYVRDTVNEFLEEFMEDSACPTRAEAETDEYLDFRDLFWPSAEAARAGGAGDGRHGDVLPWVRTVIEEQLFTADENGLLAINDVLVAPLTKAQSGVAGALRLNGTVLDLHQAEVPRDIWKPFADNLRLTLSEPGLAGLATLRGPAKVLEPRASAAHLLENHLSLGAPDAPLEASVRFGLQVGGAASPLASDNLLDLRLRMPSMEVIAVLFATVQESRFKQFPLKDVLNFSCWLSMMPVSAESAAAGVGLALHYLDVAFDAGIQATTACVACSNRWLEDLNSLVNFLAEHKFILSLKSRALAIASDMLQGDWVQGMVDEQIVAAAQRCPHDAAFGSPPLDWTYTAFKGTRELVDGALYAAFPLAQAVAIVLAQKHSALDVAAPVDVALAVPEGATLIDLTDLSSVAGWADMALEEGRNYLGGRTDSKELGVTSLLRSMLLDDNGLYTISNLEEGFDAGGVKLSLDAVTLIGLDSFTMFDALKTSGPNTFTNSIRLERLGVTVKMGLSVEGESSEQARMLLDRGLSINEADTVTVSLVLKDVDLDVSLLVAMDQDLMGELKLGSILHSEHILSCFLSTIHSVGLSEFVMDVGDIEEFSISGFISEETNESIQSITKSILDEYKTLVLDAVPAFTSNTIRPILHGLLQVMVGTARDSGACPEPDSSLDGILDFRDLFLSKEKALRLLGQGDSPYGGLFEMLYRLLEDTMSKADENGLSKMNVLVASLTERQSNEGGTLFYPGDLFKQDLDIALNGLNAAIELAVSDVKVSHIDSLGAPVKMLHPVEGESSVLNNTVLIGVGPEPFRAEFRLVIKGELDEVAIDNELVLGLNLKNVDVMLDMLAQIKESSFLNFPLRDVLNLQCWMASVVTPVLDKYGIRVGEPDSGLVLKSLALAVAEARLDIECISCSSPLIVAMASNLGSKESVEDTTEVANLLFDYVSDLLGGDFVQSGLDKVLNEAAITCPHSPSYNQNFLGLKYDELIAPEKSGDSYGFLIAIVAVVAVCAVIAAAVAVVTRRVSRRRHNQWVNTLTRTQQLELERMQINEREREKDLNKRMSSLVRSSEVPLFLRICIPIVIIGNIVLFLSGHLSIGGTVKISGSFAGQDFDVNDFFEFSMAKSTIEMWNAGAKSLAILIVFFSGLWPYSKLLITFFMWFAPPRWMSSNRRGKLLRWLDVLGKWSMIDVFVLLMTLASFRLSIASPDHLNFLPDDLYSINMLVVPLWGLYANMLAQLVSQVLSHVIIHYHRKDTMAAVHLQEELDKSDIMAVGNLQEEPDQPVHSDLAPPNLDDTPETLRDHHFKLDYEASNKYVIVRKSVHWVLAAALLLLTILVVCGCALPSFGIEMLGIVGLAVESGNEFEEAKVFYSVFGLANMITDQARYLSTVSDYVGLGTLASLLVITVFLVPLAQTALLLAQWFAPMTKRQRMRSTILNEILDAWQYMEVYVLSIIIAAWQLGGVSEYMINVYCDPFKSTFTSLSYYGILKESDAQCFRVDASVESASWILVASSLTLFILNHFIVGASSQKALDDDTPVEQRLQSKQDTVTIGMTIPMTVSESVSNNKEDCSTKSGKVCILPVKPRFTDYYFVATTCKTEEQDIEYEAEPEINPSYETETANLPID